MLKLRLVALGTILAVFGLVYALVSYNRHRLEKAASPSNASSEVSAAMPSSSGALPPSSAEVPGMPSPSPNGPRDYAFLPEGKPVPELPASAPKTCSFGAILFTFEGVQAAPRHPRTKSEAFELAKALLPEAEIDFAAAAKKGDPGSLADAGTIGRGILERSVEHQLFTLEKGKVYPEPIETPRGYWILRRIR
jgi:hypothetical protein